MNILKRIIGGILVAAVAFSVLGCSKKDDNKISDLKVGYQTEMPKEGEEIAGMTTNMGQIKIRFFPEVAPKAVENFKTHSKDGYSTSLKNFSSCFKLKVTDISSKVRNYLKLISSCKHT